MGNFRIEIEVNNQKHETLADILPESGELKALFIAKTPAPISVQAGHYFQGKQGTMFWNKLSEYDILKFPFNKYPDEYLLSNNFGITDIVKVPREYGNEPTNKEYKDGLKRILSIIDRNKPKVIVFVYKAVLDKILKLNFGIRTKSSYGFNSNLDKYFNSKVFVFPTPGTPCTREQAITSMTQLKKIVNN